MFQTTQGVILELLQIFVPASFELFRPIYGLVCELEDMGLTDPPDNALGMRVRRVPTLERYTP